MGRFGESTLCMLLGLTILCGGLSTNTANAAGLLTPVGGQQSLAIESQKVDVRINNGVAVTTVTQVFRNSAAQPLEALYTFPCRGKRASRTFRCGSTARKSSAKCSNASRPGRFTSR